MKQISIENLSATITIGLGIGYSDKLHTKDVITSSLRGYQEALMQ